MWKEFTIFSLALAVFAVLESSFFVHFLPAFAMPDFVFAIFFLAVYFGFSGNGRQRQSAILTGRYVFWAFVILAGIVAGIFSPNSLGLSAGACIVSAFVIKKIRQSIFEGESGGEGALGVFLICFACGLAVYDFLQLIYFYFFDKLRLHEFLGWNLLWQALASVLVALIGFFIIRRQNNKNENL